MHGKFTYQFSKKGAENIKWITVTINMSITQNILSESFIFNEKKPFQNNFDGLHL